MTLTERANQARAELLRATRGTDLQEIALKALSLTAAEMFDGAFDQGYESAMGELAILKAGGYAVT